MQTSCQKLTKSNRSTHDITPTDRWFAVLPTYSFIIFCIFFFCLFACLLACLLFLFLFLFRLFTSCFVLLYFIDIVKWYSSNRFKNQWNINMYTYYYQTNKQTFSVHFRRQIEVQLHKRRKKTWMLCLRQAISKRKSIGKYALPTSPMKTQTKSNRKRGKK